MSDAPDASQAPGKAAEPHPLDALTGGAFSAATSGERAARIRDWLATTPDADQLQAVFKELSTRDKGASRAVRERIEEIRRAKNQDLMATEWAEKAEALLGAAKLNIADALAWQRDAAKAGAPLSREPLQTLKLRLSEHVKVIEDLQHRVQVQREAAVLLAQRIEVLSTKPLQDARTALDVLRSDVDHWQAQAEELFGDARWASVEARFPPLLEAAKTQLLAVWSAFQSVLEQAIKATDDPAAPLPNVPVWADELRAARGLPTEAEALLVSEKAARMPRPKVDPEMEAQAIHAVREALAVLEQETAQGHGKASAGAAAALRAVLKVQGKYIDDGLEHQVHAALVAAGELEGWQRWSADQVRTDLIAKAEALLQRPEGQALGGRKMQESLRHLREQWKLADQGSPANHALWKKFDEACNNAHKVVESWLEKVRAEAAEHKNQRTALIAELSAWAQQQASDAQPDWKSVGRALHQFSERWRNSGHVGEKLFAELQAQWKLAWDAASQGLEQARKDSLSRRHAMIDEAVELAGSATLRLDAIKALQQRWQAEAQSVPLERRHEQKLWDAFRKPIDDMFHRRSAERERTQNAMTEHDRLVLEAAKAVEQANASGDAQRIRAAVQALEAAMRSQRAEPTPSGTHTPSSAAETSPGDAAPAAQDVVPAPVAPRPVVAVRGDDRPGMKKDQPTSLGRAGKPAERRDARRAGGDRSDAGRAAGRWADRGQAGREERGPRLGDAAFRAQRDAMESAQHALRKLAAQAHGEAVTQVLDAWAQRNGELLPAAQELGGRVSSAARNAWQRAVANAPKADAPQALLRLEMAAEVPTPAEQLAARRALQLQLLTRRNDPSPAQTWSDDVTRVLEGPSDEASARRLQNALKVLLRR